MFSSLLINKDFSLFTYFGIFFIGLGFLAVILAIFKIFYLIFFIIYFIFGLGFFGWLYFSKKIIIQFNREKTMIFAIICIVTSIFLYFSSPTIFSGRDQGSLSEAAIRLAQNHQLEFSTPASSEFFKIYGVGHALNFPGFDYLRNGNLITQFPIGYIAWLAAFFSVFGYFGLQLANFISLIIFVFSFYFLVEKFVQKATTKYFSLGIILTSFVFWWFFKFTLSENLAWMLVWFGIYQFVLFWNEEKKENLILALLTFGFFLVVRIEALIFLVMIFILLWQKYRGKIKTIFDRQLRYLLLGLAIFYSAVIYVNNNFYLGVAKSFLKPFFGENEATDKVSWFRLESYLANVFSLYGILIIMIFGFLGAIYFWRQKKYTILVPLIIVLPSFYYLVIPNITLDHPWMLRRFSFAIYPVLALLTILFLDQFFKKKIFSYLIFSLMILSNIFLMLIYLPFVPQQKLAFEKSSMFSKKDLVLVDRLATGDGFSMLTGPMSFREEKNAVYFFNLNDLMKINLDKFEKVYLIIPDENLKIYQESAIWSKLKMVANYQLNNPILDSPEKTKQEIVSGAVEFPLIERKMAVYGNIFEYIK